MDKKIYSRKGEWIAVTGFSEQMKNENINTDIIINISIIPLNLILKVVIMQAKGTPIIIVSIVVQIVTEKLFNILP